MFKKLRNIGIIFAAILLLGSPVLTEGAGIEAVIGRYHQDAANAYEDYEIPVEKLDKDGKEEQETSARQDKIDSTIIVGAKTLDITRIRELLTGLVVSCGILIFFSIQKSEWYRRN